MNIEAASLIEWNKGLRDHYEYKKGVLAPSLFKDHMRKVGLRAHKDKTTRDIICLEFNYGTRSYEEEREHLIQLLNETMVDKAMADKKNDKELSDVLREKTEKISGLIESSAKLKDRYEHLSKEEIRELCYRDGISIAYKVQCRNGGYQKEVVDYKMLFRSTGKAKKGSCVFINRKLWKKAIDYLYMGLELPKDNAPLVEMSAYAPLTASGIVGKVKINPKNILILRDVDRNFITNVISVETDEERHCIAKKMDEYTLKNTLFDGQSLIDSRICPEWFDGYGLLRQHMFKSAAFISHIQKFFMDYYGENYETATVTDMFGNVHFVKDIEMITTDNSTKWLKFDGVTYDYWCQKVGEDGCEFGVVKTSHASKSYPLQKMSYQMVNSLDIETMDKVAKPTLDFIETLKRDDDAFLDFLKKNANYMNGYKMLSVMMEKIKDFKKTDFYREEKDYIIQKFSERNLRTGRLYQNAENLVIVGSPYAMLLYGATGNESMVDSDTTFCQEPGTIQCYTRRFDDGEYLAFFRSPFNSKNNLTYLHNRYDKIFDEYFALGNNIIAVNLNGTDFQDRNNGSDQDSDFGYTTNQPDIVSHAKKCYATYPTIVNNIPKDKKTYKNTPEEFAKMDNMLAASQRSIGQSSDLAQICQTYEYNFDDPKYGEYVCILSVLAQVSIDSAKRQFDVDLNKEIGRIKKDIDVTNNGYPIFWKRVKDEASPDKIDRSLICPMNYLSEVRNSTVRCGQSTIPLSNVFIKHEIQTTEHFSKRVESLLSSWVDQWVCFILEYVGYYDDYQLSESIWGDNFDSFLSELKEVDLSSGKYLGLVSWLIDRALGITPRVKAQKRNIKTSTQKNRLLLLEILFESANKNFMECFVPL